MPLTAPSPGAQALFMYLAAQPAAFANLARQIDERVNRLAVINAQRRSASSRFFGSVKSTASDCVAAGAILNVIDLVQVRLLTEAQRLRKEIGALRCEAAMRHAEMQRSGVGHIRDAKHRVVSMVGVAGRGRRQFSAAMVLQIQAAIGDATYEIDRVHDLMALVERAAGLTGFGVVMDDSDFA